MTNDLIRKDVRTKAWTQGEHLVKIKAMIGVMLLQAMECQRLPANHHKLGMEQILLDNLQKELIPSIP